MSDTENEPATIASLMSSDNAVNTEDNDYFLSSGDASSKLTSDQDKSLLSPNESVLPRMNLCVWQLSIV